MGVRSDKIRMLYRYLIGTTGIPSLKLDGLDIEGPFPYVFTVTTAGKLQVWHDNIMHRNENKCINIHIRWDRNLESVDKAWVGMTLHDFTTLLKTHYESMEKEGRTNAAANRW